MGRAPETTTEEVFETCFTGRPDRWESRQTPEVTELMDCSHETGREKLRILVDHGELRSKKMGAVVFWRPCFTKDVGAGE